ncbi:MAG: hypothetical protein ABTR92_05300 [Candidatus Accumulibacter phosphatis]|jgi:hypothetical protein
MNYYRITYSIDDKNERVYPQPMKGVVFVMTQDHASEHFMVGGTEATIAEDGKSIVALTGNAAEVLIQDLRESFPKQPPNPYPGAPFPPAPRQ